jgi:tetratricopeptide (TPR) repeat protein
MKYGSGNWLVLGSIGLTVLSALVCTGSAAERPDPLVAAVTDIRLAMHEWNLDGMTNAAARVADLPAPTDETRAYWAHYWRGIALLHAVFHVRKNEAGSSARELDPPLRREALDALQHAVALREDCAEAHAAIAALYGMAIKDGNWLTAIRLGPRVMHHGKVAERSAENPRATYLIAISELRSGRGARRLVPAREKLLQAIASFESERQRPVTDPLEPRWGYDHTLMFMGQICAELGDVAESERWFAQARSVNPHIRTTREKRE